MGNFDIGNSKVQLCWRGATNNARFGWEKLLLFIYARETATSHEAGVDYLHSLFAQRKSPLFTKAIPLHYADLY